MVAKLVILVCVLLLVPLCGAWNLNPEFDDDDGAGEFYRREVLHGEEDGRDESESTAEKGKDEKGKDYQPSKHFDDTYDPITDMIERSGEFDEAALDKMMEEEEKALTADSSESSDEGAFQEFDDSSDEPKNYFAANFGSESSQEKEAQLRKGEKDMDGFLMPGELPKDLGEAPVDTANADGGGCSDKTGADGKPKKCQPGDQMAEEDAADGLGLMDQDEIDNSFQNEYGAYLEDLQSESSLYEKKKVNLDHLYGDGKPQGIKVTETKKNQKKDSNSDVLEDTAPAEKQEL